MWTTSSEGFRDRTWMLIHIAAASVLNRTIRDSNIYIRAHDIRRITAIPGLSLNTRASNQFTVLQNRLLGKLKTTESSSGTTSSTTHWHPTAPTTTIPAPSKNLSWFWKESRSELLRLSTVDGSLKENSCQISVNDSQKQESELLRWNFT